jgi:hypothetical protein
MDEQEITDALMQELWDRRVETTELKKERDDARMELLAYDALHGRIPLKQAAKLRQWGYLIKEDSIGKR